MRLGDSDRATFVPTYWRHRPGRMLMVRFETLDILTIQSHRPLLFAAQVSLCLSVGTTYTDNTLCYTVLFMNAIGCISVKIHE